MSAIQFVVRDGAGNIQRGEVAGEGAPGSIVVGAGEQISLNLTRGQVFAYEREGQTLQLTLADGRVITIEGFFSVAGEVENQLFLSADGYLAEVQLTEGAAGVYYAEFLATGASEKFATNDDLYFMRSADAMLAQAAPADDEVGMLANGLLGLGGLSTLGLGTAAIAATTLIPGGGNGTPAAPEVDITGGTGSTDHVVNEDDYLDGIEIDGTGTPGGEVSVVVDGVTETTVVDDQGEWQVVFDPDDVPGGERETEVVVTIANDNGETTVTDTLVLDTEVALTFDADAVEGDGVINAVEAEDGTTFTGTVEAGATVIVTIDGVDYDATVTGTDWSLTLEPGVIAGGEYDLEVSVTATDAVGNTTSLTDTVVVDTVTSVSLDAPIAGDDILSAVEYDAGLTLSGSAQPGATVVVALDGVEKTVTATAEGGWSATWTASEIAEGTYDAEISVTATDPAGNTASTTGMVHVDTEMMVGIDPGQPGGDGVINFDERAEGLTLTGTMAADTTEVLVTFNGITRAATLSGDGTWAVDYASTEVPQGETDVAVGVVATDAAGNSASAETTITVDTYVNELDLTSALPGGDGVVNFDENGQPIALSGVVEPGSTVQVTLHGTSQAATVDGAGNWQVTFAPGTLPEGEYDTSLEITATDAAGNTSELTEAVRVDTVAGDLTLSPEPIEGDDVVNAAEAADGVIISGTATPGLTVTVELGDATRQVVAQGDGSWQTTFPKAVIPDGQYMSDIKASITDAAGNHKDVTDSVRIDTFVDNLGFAGPVEGDDVISGAEAANGFTVTGTVEPGSTVDVDFAGTTRTVTAQGNGTWSADFPAGAIPGGESTQALTVIATDPAGNVADISKQVQIDTIVNELTAAGPVEGDDVVNAAEAADGITLTGTVEVGSTVFVTFEGLRRAASVDAGGNWSVSYGAGEVPGGTYDAVVSIEATDAVGNRETITDTFHVDTEAPDAPGIESVTVTPGGVEYLGTEVNPNLTISELGNDGSLRVLKTSTDGGTLPWGEMLFNFDSAIPDGSHLVVTDTDAAGNATSTLVVLEEAGTEIVDLAGLDQVELGAIDLSYAKDSALTITAQDLAAITNGDNALKVLGNSDDTVTISGAERGGSERIDGVDYDIYSLGDDGTVYVEQGVSVVY
ncbi:MAG: putative flagellar system-associated repeat [Rhodobacteraceae bacterium HLUCCA08]|nr:MAG: putative flagellar system-associated repeat [Rhodobacteraceae bacterium HLUCCA08]